MVSANEPGVIRIYAVSPEGQKIKTHEYRSDGPINAGKSPDGVLANLTADKHLYMPKFDGVVLTGGWKVVLGFTFDAADGLDVSDGFIQIPLTVQNGGVKYLNATDLGNTTDIPAATPAGAEIQLGAGYTIPNGQRVKIGGGSAVISVEDDTA